MEGVSAESLFWCSCQSPKTGFLCSGTLFFSHCSSKSTSIFYWVKTSTDSVLCQLKHWNSSLIDQIFDWWSIMTAAVWKPVNRCQSQLSLQSCDLMSCDVCSIHLCCHSNKMGLWIVTCCWQNRKLVWLCCLFTSCLHRKYVFVLFFIVSLHTS